MNSEAPREPSPEWKLLNIIFDYTEDPMGATDAVIWHIWQRAESPEVVEAVRDRIKSIANDPHIKDRYQTYAEAVLKAVLTELIGQKPEDRRER